MLSGFTLLVRFHLFGAAVWASIVIPIFSWILPYLPEGDDVCAKCGAKLSLEDHSAGMNYTPP